MSNALAVIGLSYDGTDVQLADLQVFLEITKGLAEPPDVRGIDTIVPGRDGRTEGNRRNDVVAIELAGVVSADPTATTVADARSSYAVNRAAVRALFAPARARADLVALTEDGSTWTISALPLPTSIWKTIVASEWSEVSIELEGYGDWVVVAP